MWNIKAFGEDRVSSITYIVKQKLIKKDFMFTEVTE